MSARPREICDSARLPRTPAVSLKRLSAIFHTNRSCASSCITGAAAGSQRAVRGVTRRSQQQGQSPPGAGSHGCFSSYVLVVSFWTSLTVFCFRFQDFCSVHLRLTHPCIHPSIQYTGYCIIGRDRNKQTLKQKNNWSHLKKYNYFA